MGYEVAAPAIDRRTRRSLEIESVLHVFRPLLADLLATFCFYGAYAAWGSVAVATILATALGLAQLAWVWARRGAVPPLQWISLALVLIVGALSLLTGDPRYALYKASIIYLVIGLAFLRRGWLLRYLPPIAVTYLSRRVVVGFGYTWSGLLVGTGVANLLLIWTEPARTVALVMGIWAPVSKLVLAGGQYAAGRMIVRRAITDGGLPGGDEAGGGRSPSAAKISRPS